jgi:hypothetical protein
VPRLLCKILAMTRLFTVLAISGVLALGVSAPAGAQAASARGEVLTITGAPVVGATISVTQPEVSARAFLATTDEQGEWVILGLTNGPWEFQVEAEGFSAQALNAEVTVNTRPIVFVLEAVSFLPPGALPADILLRIDAASALRREGNLEAAAEAFDTLRDALPELTMINKVLAGIYRQQAEQEGNSAERQALLLRAETAESRIGIDTTP